MKLKTLLLMLMISTGISAYSTVWTVNNSGNTFTPATITIAVGDSVNFVIAGSHDAREVSQTTWNANGNTALSGGFQTSFGGGMVLPSQLTVGTHYYVCTPHASMGMKGTIIVQSCANPATPGSISGNNAICPSSTNTYNVAAVSGATSYTWILPSGWTGTSTTNSITTTAGTIGGTISVKANNACGSSANSNLPVTINSIPATPGTITGSTNVCANISANYSVAAVAGATSYTWTLPSGWTGTSSTNSISVTTGNSGGTLSVKAINSCGMSSNSNLAVTVNSAPAMPGNINGSTTICEASMNTYSVAAVSGATSYTWTLPSGWSGTSTTNTINTTSNGSSGNISVTANNTCGASSAQTIAITTNVIDNTVSVSGVTLTANEANASYKWINCSNNAVIPGQIAQSFTATENGSYAVIITKTNCVDTSTCQTISSLGINNNIDLANITIVPNPTNGILKISFDDQFSSPNNRIEIYNIQGKKILNASLKDSQNEFDISHNAKGIYLIKVNIKNRELTKKLILN